MSDSPGFHHVPVLRDEVVRALQPRADACIVDCTVGGAGHTRALLDAAPCRVVALDRDPAALEAARERCGAHPRLTLVRAAFGDLARVLADLEITEVDGVLADLGVSSHQLDRPERGFSFMRQGPVDMRMDPDAALTAAQIVNQWSEDELIRILRDYGEERRARRVAQALVAGRPWDDTLALASAVASAVGGQRQRIHPATRTFQAIRIATNQELAQLRQLLPAARQALTVGGRMALITFHSLEDRMVKRFIADESGKNRPRDAFGNPIGEIHLKALRPITPASDDPNPRARSARLRVAEKIA